MQNDTFFDSLIPPSKGDIFRQSLREVVMRSEIEKHFSFFETLSRIQRYYWCKSHCEARKEDAMMKTEKKQILPNEGSLGRWFGVLVVGLLLGGLLSVPLYPLIDSEGKQFMGMPLQTLVDILYFIPFFFGMVMAIRWIGKTSLRAFILGVGGKVSKKVCLTVFVLFAGGFFIPYLITANNLSLRGVDGGEYACLLLTVLLTVWAQTTFEELLFRGLFLRWACKNKVGYSKKALLVGVVTSIAFALAHATNPEVTAQSGLRVAMAIATYAIPGLVYFLADLHFGSLLPGIIMHWVNNFVLITVVSSEVTVLPMPTLLVDHTANTAEWGMLSTLLLHLPMLVYLLLNARKKKNL